MECYLDNAATTRPFSEVCDLVTRVMYEDFGNPSSLHMKGVIAERYVRQAREQIAKTLKCAAKNIVFTSGGTESNNMALIGSALANARAGKHIITTCFEHAAVYEPLLYLEKMGYEVTYLPVDSMGHVSEETLENALRKDTILVSTMLVNNEVGAILDVEKFSKIVKAFNKDIIFHVDAIQAYGKMNIYPKRMGIDLLSVSGHKIHGPKGTGFLYVGDKVKIHPYIHGGGQQQGMRSGTENVPGIVGYGVAAERAARTMAERTAKEIEVRDYLINRILTEIPNCRLNGDPVKRLPNNCNISFEFIEGESLLIMLDMKGICASSGSACTSGSLDPSHVLLAIGLPHEIAHGSLRMTLSAETTKEEIDYTIDNLKEIVAHLRSMSPLYEDFMKKQK